MGILYSIIQTISRKSTVIIETPFRPIPPESAVGVIDRMAEVAQCQLHNKSWPLFREVIHTDVVALEGQTVSAKIPQFTKQNSPGQGHRAVKLNTPISERFLYNFLREYILVNGRD